MLVSLIIAASITAIVLGWDLYRRIGPARIAALNDARRRTSLIVSPGEILDGLRRRAVALAVTDSTLFYESRGTKASLELEQVREIEYDTVSAAGVDIRDGRVLRLHSDGRTFEFVLPNDVVSRWYSILPPRRARGEGARVQGWEPIAWPR